MRDCDCVLVALAGAGAVEVLVGGHVRWWWLCRCRGFGFLRLDEVYLADRTWLCTAIDAGLKVNSFARV